MNKAKEDASITLEILARSEQEVALQAGVAEPMQKLQAAWEFQDLDPFTCDLKDLEDYLASGVHDSYTRGVATGVYLARCADRAGKLLGLPASEVH